MKVGILTIPFNNNYGGYLQCYALITVLRELGHEPVVINRRQRLPSFGLGKIKAYISNRFLGRKDRKYNIRSMEEYYNMKGKMMFPFVNSKITPLTPPIYNKVDYRLLNSMKLDTVIVGSDQVWRPKYVPDIEEYFLKYVPNGVRKISYAASLGSDMLEYNKKELDNCSTLLQSFFAVSTREHSGRNIISRYLGRNDVQVVLDPTMLLNKADYLGLIEQDKCEHKKQVFAYILDRTPEKNSLVNKIASSLSANVCDIMKIDKYAPYSSVEDWLFAVSSSSFVITDSFHGTVFSILFNRPFWVIGNEKRGNGRILDLLSTFDLEDRLIDMRFPLYFNDALIDWEAVNIKLEEQRKKSIAFLKSSLE